MSNDQNPDLSGLNVTINGHSQRIVGYKFRSGTGENDGKMWFQVGLQDSQTGHTQSLAIEVRSLMKVWNKITGVPDQVKAGGRNLQEFSQSFIERCERAVEAFQNDLN